MQFPEVVATALVELDSRAGDEIRDRARDEHVACLRGGTEVTLPLADDLVGDRHPTAPHISELRLHPASVTEPARIRKPRRETQA